MTNLELILIFNSAAKLANALAKLVRNLRRLL
jgi:hypothetical protein